MNMKSIKNKFAAYFIPEEWCIAVRFNDNSSTTLIDDRQSAFKIVPNTRRYWAADPFLAKQDGRYYLFFEMYDRLKRKGLLGCREISENGFGKMHVIYECDYHMSYPFIYNENNNYYIIPECGASGELMRLQCERFPFEWKKDVVLLKDRLTDTTLFSKDGVDYLISQRIDDSYTFDRIDLFYAKNGTFCECSSNPVKTDISSARCAGKVFEYKNRNIRPSQDCGASYGEKLNFNVIGSISENSYCESNLCCVKCSEIKLNRKNHFIGIHTYNKLDHIEVIDLKLPNRPNFYNSLGVIRKLIKKFLRR